MTDLEQLREKIDQLVAQRDFLFLSLRQVAFTSREQGIQMLAIHAMRDVVWSATRGETDGRA